MNSSQGSQASLIDWSKTKDLLGEDYYQFYKSKAYYVDDEIEGEVTSTQITNLLTKLPSKDQLKLENPSVQTEDKALFHTWEFKNGGKIQHGSNGEDQFIAYADSSFLLIAGCYGCHPFVMTNDFNFDNSDGSTNVEPIDASFDNVMNKLKEYVRDFVLNQIH